MKLKAMKLKAMKLKVKQIVACPRAKKYINYKKCLTCGFCKIIDFTKKDFWTLFEITCLFKELERRIRKMKIGQVLSGEKIDKLNFYVDVNELITKKYGERAYGLYDYQSDKLIAIVNDIGNDNYQVEKIFKVR